jgi:hypothetical protein
MKAPVILTGVPSVLLSPPLKADKTNGLAFDVFFVA